MAGSEQPVALATGGAEATVSLPRLAPRIGRGWSRARQLAVGSTAGTLALGALTLGLVTIVLLAASEVSHLVPRSWASYPGWESGPLHGLIGHPLNVARVLTYGLSAVVGLMLIAYAIAVLAARSLSARAIAIWVLAVHLVLLLSPTLQFTDLFNYLGYARLGALHHLNPYTHVIHDELHDPVYVFASWHNLRSPYGPLFTALSYPLAFLPLPVAYWALKLVTVLLSLAFLTLVWRCAKLLGRDPRVAVLFVAANPIYLIYAVGGFHNDFLMLVPSTAAIALLLSRRDRAAGAALTAAVAVKFSAVLLLPFLLVAVPTFQRRLRILTGAALAAMPLIALSLALFGFSLPNLADQSTLLNDFAVPNVVGLLIGAGGGTPTVLTIANVLLAVAVVCLLRFGRDWLAGAGWATLALIASLAWLVPWYVIWVLPLAALGTSVRLRRASAAMTVYLVIAFIPLTGHVFSKLRFSLLDTPAGKASTALTHKLAE